MKVTLTDVAQAAGVSRATASMALNDTGRLSAETRERVLAEARSLGYRLRSSQPAQKAPLVAVLMNFDAEWAFIFEFIRPLVVGLSEVLRSAGNDALVLPFSSAEDLEELCARIRRSEAAAVVTLHYGNEQLFSRLEGEGLPVVLVMNNNYQDRFYSVCVDDFQGAYEGACHLIRSGHRRIAYVDCTRPDLPQLLVDRFFGFRKAVEEFGLDFDEGMRLRYEHDGVGALAASLARLLGERPDVSAIFALDDELALRVHAALALLGKRVPADLSLIAPGDVLDYGLPNVPPISTMRIDTDYMGRLAGQMVLNRVLRNPQELHVLKIKQQLMRRGSVGTGPFGAEPGYEAEKVEPER